MDHAGIMEAWRLWGSGKLTDDFLLYGIKVLWWARIGKGLELVGGLTIVLDIIGPVRLRSWGESLHKHLSREFAIRSLKAPFQWLWYFAKLLFHDLRNATWRLLREPTPTRVSIPSSNMRFNNALAILNIIVSLYLCFSLPKWLPTVGIFDVLFKGPWIGRIAGFALIYNTIGAVTTCLLVVLAIVIGLLLDWVVIQPLAFVIERQHFEKWAKGVALILLLVGFHFDLLAA